MFDLSVNIAGAVQGRVLVVPCGKAQAKVLPQPNEELGILREGGNEAGQMMVAALIGEHTCSGACLFFGSFFLNLFAPFDVSLSFCLLLVCTTGYHPIWPVNCFGFAGTCQILLKRRIMGRTCVEASQMQM